MRGGGGSADHLKSKKMKYYNSEVGGGVHFLKEITRRVEVWWYESPYELYRFNS